MRTWKKYAGAMTHIARIADQQAWLVKTIKAALADGTVMAANPASTSWPAQSLKIPRIPLQKWFLGIALIINAKKSLSSCQLARDLDMNQRSAWFMQQRIRAQMAGKQGEILLQGIVGC